MESSSLVLLITAIAGVVGIVIIIAAVLASATPDTGTTGTTGTTGVTGLCVGPGSVPEIDPPFYSRISPKSTCDTPLSNHKPSFPSVKHSVVRSYRLRTIREPISPNHWIGNAMYQPGDIPFFAYPYYGQVEDNGFRFSWPETGILTQNCASAPCPTGGADLIYDVDAGPSIKIGSLTERSLSCDIVDVDALVATTIWQYRNIETGVTGSIAIPIAKGSPFITMKVLRTGVTLNCYFQFGLSPNTISNIYTLNITDTTGYVIFLDQPRSIFAHTGLIYFNTMTGVIRLAYFDSTEMYNALLSNYNLYPIESTIGTTSELNGSIWNVDTTFTWTTETLTNSTEDTRLLMTALPQHNIVNLFAESSQMPHPLLGPFRLVTTTNNNGWILADAVADFPMMYPSVGEQATFINTWTNEIANINSAPPMTTVNWLQWIGSLSIMILIGDMLNQDISSPISTLIGQLSLIQDNNGALTESNTLVYDQTWGGIIGSLGLEDCSGTSDSGNAFYNQHLNQYGYLLLAYAVAGNYDRTFLVNNAETALYFARTIVNPCGSDFYFPLWRNKDWYLGYSISSGLAPNQTRGKDTSDIGSAIAGYYGAYLLSTIMTDQSELQTWSLGMLGSEIAALQTCFLFASDNVIIVDPNFVQGTITNRGDTYYEYTVNGGNEMFPQRNASILVPVLKPMTRMSFDYLNTTWAQFVYPWMVMALQRGIEPESLATALGLVGVENMEPWTRDQIIATIDSQSRVYLPYGSTWSSFMYWVLSQ